MSSADLAVARRCWLRGAKRGAAGPWGAYGLRLVKLEELVLLRVWRSGGSATVWKLPAVEVVLSRRADGLSAEGADWVCFGASESYDSSWLSLPPLSASSRPTQASQRPHPRTVPIVPQLTTVVGDMRSW